MIQAATQAIQDQKKVIDLQKLAIRDSVQTIDTQAIIIKDQDKELSAWYRNPIVMLPLGILTGIVVYGTISK